MAGSGATTIVNAAKAVLMAACPSVAEFHIAPPPVIEDPVCIFLYHDGLTDVAKTLGGTIARTHHLPLWLLVNASNMQETDAIEAVFLALNDQIVGAFYAHMTLGNTVSSVALTDQRAPAYIEYMGAIYRHRMWVIDAEEIVQQSLSG